MKTTLCRHGKPGYVSYVLVLSTGLILMVLLLATYKRATNAQKVQAIVQLRNDYSEKEDAILRSIVALTPNRAIHAMQDSSNVNNANDPLKWGSIFAAALNLANARTSISNEIIDSLDVDSARVKRGNIGDSALATPHQIFHPIGGVNTNLDTSWVSSGINNSLGNGFPEPLETVNQTTIARDQIYPIISNDKVYGDSAQSFLDSADLNGDGDFAYGIPVDFFPDSDSRRRFNRLKYPNINFGYAKPGEPFVAKRNWWAFGLDVANHDAGTTHVPRAGREFVLSIYEIPSQLAISADSFMSLGDWGNNVNIQGGIFASRVDVTSDTPIAMLAARRGMTLADNAVIGANPEQPLPFLANPFNPGDRESYQVDRENAGEDDFFPVSLASESGRVAFIPINRGDAFFDRFAHANETNTVSPTTWNNYSIGAMQCAMRLDITRVASATSMEPTELRFEYKLPNGSSRSETWPLLNKSVQTSLPAGYSYLGPQTGYPTPLPNDQSFTFTEPVDLAYGYPGYGYSFILGFTGTIRFNNDTFGNPAPGQPKRGYSRSASPFRAERLESGKDNGKYCIKVLPERIAGFLAEIGAAETSINHSLAVNVDYRNIGPTFPTRPNIPGDDVFDYGVILEECKDLTSFTRGFSLVTNLRVYFGDDFNKVPATPPAGYEPTDTYYPPVSLFCPEKRYGVEEDPLSVELEGQIGSLAKADKVIDTEDDPLEVRPLDSIGQSGANIGANRVTVNLKPITHPAELPPITMMNWLVVLEERRQEFIGN